VDADALGGLDLHLDPDLTEEDEDLEILVEEPTGPRTPAGEAALRIGIRRLRPEQERGIAAALDGNDVLMVLPTGFGKSACYQIPSMMLPKPVVLVSPLLALIKDQHEKLLRFGIPCVRLDGTIRGKAREAAFARIRAGGSLLVMTTPETLGTQDAHAALKHSGISLAAIDEAHCISEWGYDFRPAYLQLGDRLRALGNPPIMALTATATEKVRSDIVRFLHLRDAVVVAGSPHRSNLAFEVLECRESARMRALARLAQRLRRPGIIYCTTTREVDTVYALLSRLGIPAHRYHGKMTGSERTAQQDLFMKPGRRTVMIATNAFGLGIDKPDIRYVVHGQSPASLEQYVQEAGRAGRDGARANCILLFDPDDRETHEALLSRSRLRPDQLYKLGSALAAWGSEGRQPTVDALALSADLGERPTNALLVPIEEAGIVELHDDGTVETMGAPEEIEARVRSLASQFATMRTQDSRRLETVAEYAHTPDCRAVFLRMYFGEEHGPACGLCDVCRGRPDRPTTFWSPIAAPPRPGKKRKRGKGAPNQAMGRGNQRRRGRNARGARSAPPPPPPPRVPVGFFTQAPGPRVTPQATEPSPARERPGAGPGPGKNQGRRGRRRRGRRRRGGPDQAPPQQPGH
ncbi:MAG: RecQ family ATP-dependent DNA helicase, partial [Alphaproteobacteria bacterium]